MTFTPVLAALVLTASILTSVLTASVPVLVLASLTSVVEGDGPAFAVATSDKGTIVRKTFPSMNSGSCPEYILVYL